MHSFFEIRNRNTTLKSVDILLYGPIPYYDWDTDKVKNTATEFVTAFKNLEKEFDTIHIRINSPGGSMFEGLPIYNVIASSTKEVHTWNDGVAASMGAVVLLAAKKDRIHAAKNSLLMIHAASLWGGGNAKQLAEKIQMLNKFDETIINSIASITGKEKQEVEDLFFDGKDHWLSAADAENLGLISHLEDYHAEKLPANGQVSTLQNMDFQEVCNAFELLREDEETGFFNRIYTKIVNALSTHPPKLITNQTSEDTMNFEQELEILAKETPTPEELSAIRNKLIEFTGANERFTRAELDSEISTAVANATAPLNDTISAKDTEIETLTAQVTRLKEKPADPPGNPPAAKDTPPDNNDPKILDHADWEHNKEIIAEAKNLI